MFSVPIIPFYRIEKSFFVVKLEEAEVEGGGGGVAVVVVPHFLKVFPDRLEKVLSMAF